MADYSQLAGGLLSGAGSYLQNTAATGALNTAAGQQAQNASNAQFRPVGITSRFGQSGYNYGPTGQLIGAGYQVAPDIAAMREEAIRQSGANLGYAGQAQGAVAPAQQAAQSMFNLGQGYLAQNPQDVAQQWMTSQQALLQPSREQAYAQMQQGLQNTGRAGLSVAQGGSLGSANPEAQAYYNALAQQNAQLAANAQQQGQAATQFGAGLIGTGLNTVSGAYGAQNAAYAPYASSLAAASGLESLGQQPMTTSSALGELGSAAGYRSGVLGNVASNTQASANAYSPWGVGLSGLATNPTVLSGIGGLLGSWLGG